MPKFLKLACSPRPWHGNSSLHSENKTFWPDCYCSWSRQHRDVAKGGGHGAIAPPGALELTLDKKRFSKKNQCYKRETADPRYKTSWPCFESRTERMIRTYGWAYVVVTLIWPTRVWRAPPPPWAKSWPLAWDNTFHDNYLQGFVKYLFLISCW